MHGSMLTEDIDSALRVLAAGAKIASDPALVSYELAPTTRRALWKQRRAGRRAGSRCPASTCA